MPSSSFSSVSTTGDELTADTEQCGEAIASQKMPKKFLEKFAKMEMELKLSNSKIRELELENKLCQAELREQKLVTERNELLVKIAKMEQEKKEEKEEGEEVLRNWWDADYCHDALEIISPKCLMVHCKGNGRVCRSVFAKHPISSDIFYFEAKVEVKKDWVVIGLATKEMPLDEYVGWHKDSYGYRNDGSFWNNNSYKCEENASFSAGDVVGCGVNFTNRRIFFTKNGQRLATTYDIPSSLPIHSLSPCITLWRSGDKIKANFGPHFKFDVGTL